MGNEKLILTTEQLDFMLKHHQEIEQAYDYARRGNNNESLNIIHKLSNSQEYRNIFSEMDWDDTFDRYQDSSVYDPTLRDTLIKSIQSDIQNRLSPEVDPTTISAKNNNELNLDDLGLMRLEELLDTVDDQ